MRHVCDTLAVRVLLLNSDFSSRLSCFDAGKERKQERPNFVWTEVKSFAVEFLCAETFANSTANVMLKNKRIVLT